MSRNYTKTLFTAGCAILILTACKKKDPPPVIEEAPTSETSETDTTATMAEEPTLQHVGKDAKAGSAKATFHPSQAATQAGFSENGRFVVQVSIFKNKQPAARLVEKLAQAGFPPRRPELPFHRVVAVSLPGSASFRPRGRPGHGPWCLGPTVRRPRLDIASGRP